MAVALLYAQEPLLPRDCLTYEDAVLDFTNPETVQWYQQKIEGLMRQGVSTIKCDFGEAAPYNGFYHNGRGGLYEHNLYPLRYNKALWEQVERSHPGELTALCAPLGW